MGYRLFMYKPACYALFIAGLFFLSFAHAEEKGRGDKTGGILNIRHPAVSGSFYPSSSEQLRRQVQRLLDTPSDKAPDAAIVAATAPHAGYVYSGEIAALTFKRLKEIDFDTIVIIGHDTYRNGVAFTSSADCFRTPLGDVPLDRRMIEKMEDFNRGIRANDSLHSNDHTIEIQLPFLQVMEKNCMIVPLMFGNPLENCEILANAIDFASEGKKIFILASTDMSHYPSREDARLIDGDTLKAVERMDADYFIKYLRKGLRNNRNPGLQTLICASGGIGTAILFSGKKGANRAVIQKYANSGDVPGADIDRVVGYSSVLFVNQKDQ